MAGLLSFTAGSVFAAATFTAWPSPPAPRGTDESALVQQSPPARHRCPHASTPLALLLVRTRTAGLDLARYLDADRPGGFPAQVIPYDDAATPHVDVPGDPAAWHWVGVNLDRPGAYALASRLRELPAIADARVLHVVE